MNLTKRHLRIFFSNPSNLIVSLLSVVVILALYFLFIKEFTIEALNEIQANKQDVALYVDLLMVSGLLIVIATTCSLPICSIFVKDKENGIMKDFLISPVSKIIIYFSYILAATIISILITVLSFCVILIFFHTRYEYHLAFSEVITCIGLITLSSFVSSFMLFVFSLFFQSMTSFASFSNLFGVMIGFLTGVYIPIGYYPQVIQNGLFLFPLSQSTSLLRKVMSNGAIYDVSNGSSKIKDIIETMFGLKVEIFNTILSNNQQFFYLISIIIIMFILLVVFIKIEDK